MKVELKTYIKLTPNHTIPTKIEVKENDSHFLLNTLQNYKVQITYSPKIIREYVEGKEIPFNYHEIPKGQMYYEVIEGVEYYYVEKDSFGKSVYQTVKTSLWITTPPELILKFKFDRSE